MKSLFQKSLVTTALVTASLALAGNAMAANVHAKARGRLPHKQLMSMARQFLVYPNHFSIAAPASRSGARDDVAARSPYSYPHRSGQNFAAGQRIDVRQLIAATLGGFPPQYARIVQNAIRASGFHRSSGSSDRSGSVRRRPVVQPVARPVAAAGGAGYCGNEYIDESPMVRASMIWDLENVMTIGRWTKTPSRCRRA